MAREHRNSFVRFALAESTLHKAGLKGLELPREAIERFTGLADWSLERQREIEAADKVPFEAWRQKYLSHDTLEGHFVRDRKSTRLNSRHSSSSYAVFCLQKKNKIEQARVGNAVGQQFSLNDKT